MLPSIVANANTTKTETTIPGDQSLQSQILRKGYNDNGWNAQLRQPVLNLSGWFGYDSAKAFVKASSFALAAQEQDLIVRVAEAYLNILRTRDRLDTTNAEVTAVQRQLEQVQQRFDVGLVAITDVLESQAAYDAALVRQIQAETDHYISFETLRIFQGGRTTSRMREGRARAEQSREQLLNQRRAVVRNTRNLYKSVSTDVVRVQARLKAIRSAQSALEATQTGYEVGTRNIVDVLQAQQRLFDSQFAYADSRYNYLLNLLRLKQQTGLLGDADLEEINSFMDNGAPVTRIVSVRDGNG